jgi:chemotaxis protein histidine kinase CheA
MGAVELRRLVVESWLELIVGYLRAEIRVAQQAHARAQGKGGAAIRGDGGNEGRREHGGRDEGEDDEGTQGPTKRMMRLEVQQLLVQLEQQEAAYTRSAHEVGTHLTKLQAENSVKERELATMAERMRRKLVTAKMDAEKAAVELETKVMEERRKREEEMLEAEATEAKLRGLLKSATAEVGGLEARMRAEHEEDLAELRAKHEAQQSNTEQVGRQQRERQVQQVLGMRAELDRLGKLAAEAQAEKRQKMQQEEDTLRQFLRGMRRGMRVIKHGRNGKKERRQLKFSRAAAAQIAEVFVGAGADCSHQGSPSANGGVGTGRGRCETLQLDTRTAVRREGESVGGCSSRRQRLRTCVEECEGIYV